MVNENVFIQSKSLCETSVSHVLCGLKCLPSQPFCVLKALPTAELQGSEDMYSSNI